MKKSFTKVLSIAGIIISAISATFLIRLIYAWFSVKDETGGIGIIGGADGPTAVFIIAKLGFMPLLSVIGLIIGIVCIIVSAIIIKNNKNK